MRRTLPLLSATALVTTIAALPTTAVAGPPEHAAARGHQAECSLDVSTPLHEMRGVWIASVSNIDWPSRKGMSPQEAQDELLHYYEDALDKGLNTVIVQVRPTADAIWDSELEPSSLWLTGEQGADFGGWDPMEFAVEQAHARGLDFHAWFNPYRVTQTGYDLTDLAPDHPALQHPEWIKYHGGRYYYDPGVPAAREHTENVIMEVVENYDVDGIHFDDYFYPDKNFPDADTYATYGAGFDTLEDWRRDNVDTLIQNLDQRIHEAKPWVQFGVSPFAVWRNASTDPVRGSATQAGAQTYDDMFADTRLWVQQGWVDYILPQIYWNIGFTVADYQVLVPWWADLVDGTDVALWIGEATYKVGTSPQAPQWYEREEMRRHLDLTAQFPQVTGHVYYSANQLAADRLDHWELVQDAYYQRPALPPAVNPGTSTPADAPTHLSVRATAEGSEVTWRAPGTEHGFALYKVPEDVAASLTDHPVHERHPGKGKGRVLQMDPCRAIDAQYLVATPGTGARSWTDPEGGEGYVYVLTALAMDNTQSAPTGPVRGR